MSKVKILLLRRWYMVGGAALLAAAAIFLRGELPGLRQRCGHDSAAAHLLCGAQPEGLRYQLRRRVGDAKVRQFSC